MTSQQARDASLRARIVDPARPNVVVAEHPLATPEQRDAAIAAAVHASTDWSAFSAEVRAEQLARALDAVTQDPGFVADCARLLTLETGKILHESEVDLIVFGVRWRLALELAAQVDRAEQLEPVPGSPVRTTVTVAPLGVVTIIVPYNWPLAIAAASLPAALLAGNTVIVKPPATAPLATTAWLQRIAAALPDGVLTVLSLSDDDASALVTDDRIAKVCFTGSVATGARLAALAAPRIGRLTLELGGNDAAIVCSDAMLDDEHLDRMFAAMFDSSGQICMNIKRVYVHSSRRDELIAGLRARLSKVVLGHGLDPATTHGPVHTEALALRLEEMITEAERGGAVVERFGRLPMPEAGDAPGWFVRPALVIDPPHTARIVTDEQFGPAIPVLSFGDETDAVSRANASWAGLGGSVWSADIERAQDIARTLSVGYAWVNDHGATRLDLRAPFGGWRSSGYGREQGLHGIREFQDTRTIATTRSGGD